MTQNEHKGVTAIVEWFVEMRGVSRVMANAALGITSCGTKERIKIQYKPGELVDEARVIRAVNQTIQQVNTGDFSVKICNPKVISIQ
jgi:hypothetical protein